MAQVKMYSQKDKRFVNFPIACTPSDDECKKCQLKFTCDKAKIKTEEQIWQLVELADNFKVQKGYDTRFENKLYLQWYRNYLDN